MEEENDKLRSVALRNAKAILLARQRIEQELLEAQKSLQESQERLHVALSVAGTGTYRWDIESGIMRSDDNLRHLLELDASRPEHSFHDFVAAIHPEDRSRVTAKYERAVQDLGDVNFEFRLIRKDGTVHWLENKARIFASEGRTREVIGACIDITSRKHAEEVQLRLAAIVESSEDAIVSKTLDGIIKTWNRGAERIFGYKAHEVINKPISILFPADRLAEEPEILRKLRRGERIDHYETIRLRKDGTPLNISLTVSPVLNEAGEVIGVSKIARDITQRKQLEVTIEEERRRLELLNRTGAVLSSELDFKSLLQVLTDTATELSGAKFGAFFDNTTDKSTKESVLYAVPGAAREAFEKLSDADATPFFAPILNGAEMIRCSDILKDPGYGKAEAEMLHGHLPIRSYMVVPVVSRSGEAVGRLFLGHPAADIFTEKTERIVAGVAAQAAIAIDNSRLYDIARKANAEREALLESERAARSEAERMGSIKDEFLATLSHELRTPLSAILGWSQVLRSGGISESDLSKGLETIERNARSQARLIDDLLDMNRIASGKVRLEVQPIQPSSFVEVAVETISAVAALKGITIEKILDTSAGSISGDPNRLQQIMWNLLSNAVKFTPKGGKVQVLLQRVNSHIEIAVSDTGAGITPEFLPYLFDRFRQSDASTTRKHGGLGLGLSIVKHLVELHGGSVSAYSKGEGSGATFTVQLPLQIMHAPYIEERYHPRTSTTPPIAFSAIDLSDVRVLVVDDEPDARELISRVLSDCQAIVIVTGSGREALALVEKEKPHVLVSDIGMPEMDGYELLKRVRALGKDNGGKLPAIALTAFARSEDRTRALRAGYLVHVSKPVEPSELIATVASVVGKIKALAN
jgi:PAS domain S-box-containing protein